MATKSVINKKDVDVRRRKDKGRCATAESVYA